ncbi:MAG: hypothetical protein AAFP19_03290 [Bacteroidota bacterium]
MKKVTQYLSILLLLSLFIGINDAEAQNRRKRSSKNDEYFDDKGGFAHRLWYGGNIGLGFSGNSAFSSFSFGLSPMVGYKIFEQLSIGPRVGFQYTYLKGPTDDGRVHAIQPISYSMGLFGRYKFFESIFAHVEVEFQSEQQVFQNARGELLYDFDEDKIFTERNNRENFYVGAGYHSGSGRFGYEIVVLYNLLIAEDDVLLPWDIRFGFTYNF